jgi:homoserine dehydrogenase
VLSDISALRYDYRYEYKKITSQAETKLSNDYYLKVFVSVDEISKIKRDDFEWIEEWHNEFRHNWLIGTIHADKLASTGWWKQDGVSLIACPGAVAEDVSYKAVSRRSLELAGVV